MENWYNFTFFVFFLVLHASVNTQELCKKFEDTYPAGTCKRKFCPLERIPNDPNAQLLKGIPNQCRAHPNQYKCGVFFKNLPGLRDADDTPITGESLSWIGAVPDILRKEKIASSAEIRASFGNFKRKDFNIKSKCDWSRENPANDTAYTTANARCYLAMKKASKIKMDECSKTIVNEDGRKTVGDILCDKIDFFYGRGDFGNIPKPNNIDNVEIAFKYSACENDWTTIASGTNPLEAPEKLCCQRLDGTLKFKRCDGSSFNSKC